MKPGGWREENTKYPSLAGFLLGSCTFLVIFFLTFSPVATGEGVLTLNTSGPGLFADISLNGYGLGMRRTPGGRYGLGLSLSEELLPETGNWEIRPFSTGLLHPGKKPEWDTVTVGINTNYFDYRIGGWTLSVDSLFWLNTSGYRLASNGAFSVGKVNLNYELRTSDSMSDEHFWFPRSGESEFTHLYRGSLTGIRAPGENYLTASGGKSIPLGDNRLTWTQGVSLDYQGRTANLAMGTDISYRGSSLAFLIDNLRLKSWSLRLKGDKISIGYLSIGDYRDWQGVSIGYHDDIEFGLELLRKGVNSGNRINLVARW